MHISINWSLNTSEVFPFFFFMNAVVILCFLNKSSVIKNLDLSSVLPVDPVTYIMTNITFFWLKSAFIARHETRNFKLPWDIFGDYGNAETLVICFRWLLWYDAGANIKISHAGNACQFHAQMVSRSAYPACQAGREKTGNETSARREIWDQSLATILDKITKETSVWLAVRFCSVQSPHRAQVSKQRWLPKPKSSFDRSFKMAWKGLQSVISFS